MARLPYFWIASGDPGRRLRAWRSQRDAGSGPPDSATYRDLVGYGLRFYPGSLTGFFEYRADAFLIAFLIADASADLGYYSMAVGLAEMGFFFPRAVSSLFFPQVAGSSREDSDRQVAVVARVTLLVSAVGAIMLVPAAALMISILLPAFSPSLAPLLLLLPGVVALSGANVVGSYLRGIGRPGLPSTGQSHGSGCQYRGQSGSHSPVGDRRARRPRPWFRTPFRRSRCR